MCVKLDCDHKSSNFSSPQMPPSVTLGSEPQKGSAHSDDLSMEGTQIIMKPRAIQDFPSVDVSSEESTEVQKAIALSLQDQQKPSPAEDREGAEPTNPHEQKRSLDSHVGLKNIGNSCWFNVVVQPLFHIPAFRNLIFNSPPIIQDESSMEEKSSNSKLVPTLRLLYSLLLASEKKFIDPSDCVSIFQGQEMMKNTQQDVCEFVHKLLQLLEEEFKLILKEKGIEKESNEWKITSESDFENPIKQLFYGHSRKGDLEEPTADKLETFGVYPLTVQNYKDIHESILASMVGQSLIEEDIDTVAPANQDTWFKKLPPVLIFSLSRFAFSKEKKRAEKVHNKFDFQSCLYMDRYMESNMSIVKEKHLEVARLKQELKILTNTLDMYERFGSGDGKYPIVDVLKYTLEFAQQDRTEYSNQPMEVEETASMDVDMAESHSSLGEEEISETIDQGTASQSSSNVLQGPSKKRKISPPAPKGISQSELYTLRQCLPRWQTEMELKVAQIRSDIRTLDSQIESMYEETSLMKVPYQLHSVVVHEGQASGGHYWVYIRDSLKGTWSKFNDIQVCQSDWGELLQDSVGGQNNASAYCLMYIDQTRYDRLFAPSSPHTTLSNLPLDLQEYVKKHNMEFEKVIADWDLQVQREKEAKAIVPATPNSPDQLYVDKNHTTLWLDLRTMLNDLIESSLKDLNEQVDFNQNQSREWIKRTLSRCLARLREVTSIRNDDSEYQMEVGLIDFGIYMAINGAPDNMINWYALEVLWQQLQAIASPSADSVLAETQVQLHTAQQTQDQISKEIFRKWKIHYEHYVRCAWYFLLGHKKYEEELFDESCAFYINCLSYHYRIRDECQNRPQATLNSEVLSVYHRDCLEKLNNNLVHCVKYSNDKNELREIEETVKLHIIPSLYYLCKSGSKCDEDSAEMVRNQWCELLSTVVSELGQATLSSIISSIFNISNQKVDPPLIRAPPYPCVLSLSTQYKELSSIVLPRKDKRTLSRRSIWKQS